MFEDPLLARVLVLSLLLFLSAFFSACEAALFSINDLRLNSLKGDKTGNIIHELRKNPKKLLVTIYLGNEIVNVAIAAIITSLMISILGNAGVALAMFLSLVLLLQFGEIIPKTFAIQNAEKFARFSAYPIYIFSILVYPVQLIISYISNTFLSMAGGGKLQKKPPMSEDEIKALINISEETGDLPSQEKEMIQSVFDFGDKSVSEVMTPRTDMFFLDENESVETALRSIKNSYYSRIPVVDSNIDTISGILYTKSLLRYSDKKKRNTPLKELTLPPFIVPESKKINDLLRDFQKRSIHIAIALDEHGGVSGLVTLDDLMEEIFGDLEDEKEFVMLEKSKYRVSGKASIEEFNEKMATTIPNDDFDTIGGFIFHSVGRSPKRGDSVTHGNIQLTVEKIAAHRIISVRTQTIEPGTDTGNPDDRQTGNPA